MMMGCPLTADSCQSVNTWNGMPDCLLIDFKVPTGISFLGAGIMTVL